MDNENRRTGPLDSGTQKYLTNVISSVSDVQFSSAGLLDQVIKETGTVVLRGVEAGPGILVEVVDEDNNIHTTSQTKIKISSTAGPSGGESNTASNIGTGFGLFANKGGVDLRFKSIKPGANVSITSDADSVTINAAGPLSGEANTASNLGFGHGIFAQKTGVDLQFKSIVAGSGIVLTDTGTQLTINSGLVGLPAGGSSGQVLLKNSNTNYDVAWASVSGVGSTASNLGTGHGVYSQQVAGDLQFKSLIAGGGVSITHTANDITITASGTGVSDFLGLTDTPNSYAGQNNKAVTVNSSGTALVFTTLPASFSGDYNDLTNKPFIPTNFSQMSGLVQEVQLSIDVRNKLNNIIPNKLDGTVPPTVNDDAADGWQVGSIWIDATGKEVYRCIDATVGLANWILTTLTTDQLSTVAITGNYNDLTNRPTIISDFLSLSDTPNSYSGNANRVVAVNNTATGLTFTTVSGEANTGSNLGATGHGVFAQKVGADLQFKKLVPGSNVSISSDANSITINAGGGAGGGEPNTASNLGAGNGVFAQKIGYDLQFKSIVAGPNITVTPAADTITISSTDTGEANTGANLGTGNGVFAQKVGTALQFKSLIAGTGVTIANTANDITINATGTGEVNTASNVGGGSGLFKQKTGANLEFYTLTAGANVSLTQVGDTLQISATGSGGGINVQDEGVPQGSITTMNFVGSGVSSSVSSGTATVTITAGEANSGANLGAGAGVFAQKTGTNLEFKSLVAGSNVTITNDSNTITVSAVGPDGGEANTASNLGTGSGVFAQKSGTDLQFKSLKAGTGITLANSSTEVTINTSGEANTMSNIGSGVGVFNSKVGVDLQLRSLVAGSGISITNTSNEINVSSNVHGIPSGGTTGQVLSKTNNTDYTVQWVDAAAAASASGANLGTGTGVYAQTVSDVLEFKSLKAGTGITLANTASEITINSTAGASLTARILVNYNSSGNITSIDNTTLPAGWSSSFTGNVVTLTHSEPLPPVSIIYYGYNASVSQYKFRTPTTTNEVSLSSNSFTGSAPYTITLNIPGSAVGASGPSGSTAYIIIKF